MSDDERIALALSALAEVADPQAVGALVDASVPVPGVIDLRFATTMPGYVGWFWTVSTSALEGVEPTVLELELLPGDGALVAPAWVPWEERLAEWRRVHPGEDDAEGDDADDEDDDEDDDDASDEDGSDDDGLDADVDETDLDDALDDDVLDDDLVDPDADDAEPDDADDTDLDDAPGPGSDDLVAGEPALGAPGAEDVDDVTGDLDDPQERTV